MFSPYRTIVTALAVLGAATMLGSVAAAAPGKTTLTPGPTHTSVGVITLQPFVPSGRQAQANKAIQKAMKKANPGEGKKGPAVKNPYRGPALGPATGDGQQLPSDAGGGSIPGPGTQTGGAGGAPIIRGRHRENATDPLSAFRVSTVTDPSNAGAGSGPSWTGEPTSANDRNAILYTANWYAAYSADNGRTWGYIDPDTAFPKLDNGFCCDQYAVSIARSGYQNIAWIMQNAATTTRNSYRLVVLKDRSGVESLDGTIEYCSYVIDSTDFSDLPSKYMLDYPAMQTTSKYLYLSANAGQIGATTVDRAVIWRIALSNLEACGGGAEMGVIESQTTLRPVNGAGSTMYFGSIPNFSSSYGKKFDINWVSDSSTTVNYRQKNITNWPTGTMSCPLDSTTTNDPCARLSGLKVLAGYKSTTRVGWMFVTGTGSSSTDYPYTRVVRFDPSTLALEGETDIWNSDFAWVYPSAGATGRGDVGGLLVAAGGSRNPKAQAFIVDDAVDWSPLTMAGIASSDEGPNGNCNAAGTGRQCLGDYFTAAAYTGCSNSLLATAIVERTIDSVAGPAHRWAWFGRESDGCVDLQESGVTAGLPASASGPLRGGDVIAVGDTTWNTGSAASGPTTTAYYLSRDAALSGADVHLGDRTVGAIAAGSSSVGTNQLLTLPSNTFGQYNVIACADDPSTIDEVSDTNNCAASEEISVEWSLKSAGVLHTPMWDRSPEGIKMAGVVRPGGQIVVTGSGRISPVIDPAQPIGPNVTTAPEAIPWDVFLTIDKRITATAKPIGQIPAGPIKPTPLPNGPMKQWTGAIRGIVRLPAIMPTGRYWLHVCAPLLADDPQPASNCSTIGRPLVPRLVKRNG